MRTISIIRDSGDYICLSVKVGKRSTRVFMTEDQAQHLSNRLQSFAKGNCGVELVVTEKEPLL